MYIFLIIFELILFYIYQKKSKYKIFNIATWNLNIRGVNKDESWMYTSVKLKKKNNWLDYSLGWKPTIMSNGPKAKK